MGVVMAFRDNAFSNLRRWWCNMWARQGSSAKVRPDMKIVFTGDFERQETRLKSVTRILRDIVAVAEK